MENLRSMTGNLAPAPSARENAVAVENEGAPLDSAHPPAVHVFHLHDLELGADLLGLVREQLEGKAHLDLEILVRPEAIARDSGYRPSRLLALREQIAELRPLSGAARGLVLAVEMESDALGLDTR